MSVPLTTTDPSDIANLARCYASCVPPGAAPALTSFIVNNVVVASQPPCNAPTAPNNVRITQVKSNSLSVFWSQPANSGSLITSYTVKMGTTSGGPYTMVVTAGLAPKHVTFGGLISGTTYYAIVIANSSAGCSSVASAEASGTTSGTPPNGLLTGLLGYWKMDEGSNVNRADATGNGWTATQAGGNIPAAAGLINNAVDIENGGARTNQGLSIAAAIDARANNTPFSMQVWINPSALGLGFSYGFSQFPGAGTAGWWVDTTNSFLRWQAYNGGADLGTINTGAANQLVVGTWSHIVITYDGVTRKIYFNTILDAAGQQAVAGIDRGLFNLTIGNSTALNAGQPGMFDESGYWNRALSQADINTLYNAGAGFPFGSFTL